MRLAIKRYSSVLGGFLVHLILGTFYTIGNMNTYIISYLRENGEPDLTYSDAIWINTVNIAGMGIIMFFAGLLDRRVGTSITCSIGCAIFTASTALTYLSVESSFLLVVITYGLMPALGSGLAYASPLVNSMKWFPESKGVVTGVTVAGFGLGALIFDQVQTLYLNPHNYSPKDDDSIYFLRHSILSRVPSVFLVLAVVYGIVQAIGVSLIFDADRHLSSDDSLLENTIELSQRHSDISPRNALKYSNFYVMWVMFALGFQTLQFMNTLYKPFGIDLQYDDQYLALVGSLASIFNALGRVVWGRLMDKYNFKTCMIVLFAMLSALMFTFIAATTLGKAFFTIWVVMIFFSFAGIFSLFPAVVATTYGPTHANTIYGMLFTAPAITGVLGAVILQIAINNLGWFYSFAIVGSMSLIGMAVAMAFYRQV